jgi:hypothetical protein
MQIFRSHDTHHYQIDDPRILSFGVITGNVGAFQIAQLVQDILHQLVQTEVFFDEIVQIGEKFVSAVGPIENSPAFGTRFEQPGFREPVQFHPDGIGRLVQLLGETAQIGLCFTIQEKLEQELHPCFGCNQGIKQGLSPAKTDRRD